MLGKLSKLAQVYRGKEPDVADKATPRAIAAVVLGAQVCAGGRPSRTLRVRSLFAARLYSEGLASIIIPSGGVGEHPPSEAAVISEVLRNADVPERDILPEAHARNTLESARLVAELARASGISGVLVVTDPLHCVRAVSMFREAGLDATAAPVYDSPMWRSRGLRRGQLLREMVAIAWYRMRARSGSGVTAAAGNAEESHERCIPPAGGEG